MIKNLRYVMLSLIAMVCGTMAAQKVTIDFDTDYATLFPTLAGTSSNDSHDGDFTETTTSTAVEGVTVTVSAKTSGNNENRIWYSAPRLRMYTGTFTVTGTDITKIEFTANNGTNFNLSTTTGTLDGKTWTGKADEIVFDVAKNTQINKIVVTLGEGSGDDDEDDNPKEPTEGTGTIDNPLTPSQAYDIVSAMPAGQTSTVDYYVKGKICSIKYTFSAQYGTATFNISDDGNAGDKEFTAYSCLYFGNKKWQEGDTQVNVGDEVLVCGKVVNYNGNTPEFASQNNYLVSLNGETGGNGGGGNDDPTTPTVPAEGEGTATSPYNVTAALAAGSGTGVYVKAFIVGVVDGAFPSGVIFSATTETMTNLLVAASADETNVNNCMPVQLPTNDVRSALNLKDHPENYQKEVTLYGNIEKYFGVTGLKTITFAILEGQEIGTNPGGNTGINNITTAAQSGQVYNMAGQKVSDNYRGLVIKNGKKVMMK